MKFKLQDLDKEKLLGFRLAKEDKKNKPHPDHGIDAHVIGAKVGLGKGGNGN
ncbi:MAG TPA: hypothetical protein VJ981_00630 [Gammaproteobacteria bacterium]|nr:hypothetical protein [Gammaproteobacteria bacterium]